MPMFFLILFQYLLSNHLEFLVWNLLLQKIALRYFHLKNITWFNLWIVVAKYSCQSTFPDHLIFQPIFNLRSDNLAINIFFSRSGYFKV